MIEKHISDTNFNAEVLSKKMGMSRMQLYRKVKALLDKSPGEYLRHYRLDKAKDLLLTKDAHVGEVAYKVGFNNRSNFTKIFKEYCGHTPSEFMYYNDLKPTMK